MRQHSRPHQVRPGAVRVRMGKGFRGRVHDGLHQRFTETVHQGNIGGGAEVPLANMGKDIRRSVGRLGGGQGTGQTRVQYGEFRPDQVGFRTAPFQIPTLLGDNTAVTPFTPRRRYGQHNSYRKRFRDLCPASEKVPEITVIARPKANGLRGVNHASAAKSYQKIETFLTDLLYPLVNNPAPGVRLHARQLFPGKPRRIQRRRYRIIRAVLFHRTAAVDQKHLRPIKTPHQFTGLLFLAVAKYKHRRRIKRKIFHILTPIRRTS